MKADRRIMDQIMMGAIVSLLLISGGTACTSLDNRAPPEANTVRINLPRCTLDTVKASSECTVKVFDGNALAAAQHGDQGEWFINVPSNSVTSPRIGVYSAPGYEPQIQALKINVRDDERVELKSKSDARGGYLAGVVFKKPAEKMPEGVCAIESFMVNKSVVINRARARFTTSTDNLGSFKMSLPAGSYMVHVEGDDREVEVPSDDTEFVVILVN